MKKCPSTLRMLYLYFGFSLNLYGIVLRCSSWPLPVFLFALVNMSQCCGGMRGWVSFAGWAEELVISNRELNKELISVTSYWLPNRKEKRMHWFKTCLKMPTMGLCFEEKCLLSLNQPSLTVFNVKSVMQWRRTIIAEIRWSGDWWSELHFGISILDSSF